MVGLPVPFALVPSRRNLLTNDSFNAFQSLTNASSPDAPPEDTLPTLSSPTSRAAARRLRRTRQRLASYRHDLIVAMRVVNGVEREIVRSEWENFLADENARCEEMRGVLDREEGKGEEGRQRVEAVRGWVEEYCGSCEGDMAGLRREKKVEF